MAAGLTKTQLIRLLAEKTELPNKTAAAFLEHLADTAIKETKKNGIFVVPGLGRLVKAHRKARVGRNPQTGEPIQIKAKTVVKFRVAKAAKDAIAPKKLLSLTRTLLSTKKAGKCRPFVFKVQPRKPLLRATHAVGTLLLCIIILDHSAALHYELHILQ